MLDISMVSDWCSYSGDCLTTVAVGAETAAVAWPDWVHHLEVGRATFFPPVLFSSHRFELHVPAD